MDGSDTASTMSNVSGKRRVRYDSLRAEPDQLAIHPFHQRIPRRPAEASPPTLRRAIDVLATPPSSRRAFNEPLSPRREFALPMSPNTPGRSSMATAGSRARMYSLSSEPGTKHYLV